MIPPEYIFERTKQKQQLRNWKLLAVILILGLVALVLSSNNLKITSGKIKDDQYIATVSIDEVLFEDSKRDAKLEKIATDESIRGLIVHVNSPGGTVVGSEKIYNILRKISKHKPVVVVMGTMATSGGYLISLAGDYIISHNGTITGSIGVIFQTAEITELAEKLGVKFNNFKTSELKAAPNPTEKLTPAVHEAIMENINDAYDYFVELVATRRGFSIEQAKALADGRIYSGRKALELKLVDAIGNGDDALEWLYNVKKLDKGLVVREVKLKPVPKFMDILLDDLDNSISRFFQNKLQGLTAKFN